MFLQLCRLTPYTHNSALTQETQIMREYIIPLVPQKESAQSLQNIYIYNIYVLKEKARAKQNSRGSPDTTSKGRRPQIDKDTANFVRYHKAQSVFSSIGIRVSILQHKTTQSYGRLQNAQTIIRGQFTGLQASEIATQR